MNNLEVALKVYIFIFEQGCLLYVIYRLIKKLRINIKKYKELDNEK